MPRLGQSSRPMAFTVSNRRASSSLEPAAAIQFAESFTSESRLTLAARKLVSASPTAIRPEAAALIRAKGLFSPMAIASPVWALKPVAVTPTSATGTCQRPTI